MKVDVEQHFGAALFTEVKPGQGYKRTMLAQADTDIEAILGEHWDGEADRIEISDEYDQFFELSEEDYEKQEASRNK